MERPFGEIELPPVGEDKRFVGLFTGMLLGGIVIGAALAILAAPISGEKLRDYLWEKSILLRDQWVNPYRQHTMPKHESMSLPIFPLDEEIPLADKPNHSWQRAISSITGLG